MASSSLNSPKRRKTPHRKTPDKKDIYCKKTKSPTSPQSPSKPLTDVWKAVGGATTKIIRSRKKTTGTRAQVSRGSAMKTTGGLTKDGLVRGPDGRLKSRAVSEQAKNRYLNPKSDRQKEASTALKNQASAVSKAFAKLREIKGSRKIDARRVIKDVGKGDFGNPEDYLY